MVFLLEFSTYVFFVWVSLNGFTIGNRVGLHNSKIGASLYYVAYKHVESAHTELLIPMSVGFVIVKCVVFVRKVH